MRPEIQDFIEALCARFGRLPIKVGDAIEAVRLVPGVPPGGDILLACDELRRLGSNQTDEPDEVIPQCKDGLHALASAVDTSIVQYRSNAKSAGLVFIAASALAAVDVRKYAAESCRPFCWMPLLPIGPKQLKAALNHHFPGADLTRRRSELQFSVLQMLLNLSSLPEKFMNCCKATPPASRDDRVFGDVSGNLKKHATDVTELLRSLFTKHDAGSRGAFSSRMNAAVTASCFGLCTIVRRAVGCDFVDSVLINPAVLAELCTAYQQVDNPQGKSDKNFVEACNNLADAMMLRDTSNTVGKQLEEIIAALMSCVLLAGWPIKLSDLCDSYGSKVRGLTLAGAKTVNFPQVNVFPRAYSKLKVGARSAPCDADIVAKLAPPAVAIPQDKFNLLLDIAVTAVVAKQGKVIQKNVCLALQAQEWAASTQDFVEPSSVKKKLTTWRKRAIHFEHDDATRKCMTEFQRSFCMIYVLVTVNEAPTSWGSPQEDEAFLSLEGIRKWCPSMQYCTSMIAVGAFSTVERESASQPRD